MAKLCKVVEFHEMKYALLIVNFDNGGCTIVIKSNFVSTYPAVSRKGSQLLTVVNKNFGLAFRSGVTE